MKEDFDNILREKLLDVEIQPSARLYSRIEDTLSQMGGVATPQQQTKRRILPLWSWGTIAAAVVAIAVIFTARQVENTSVLVDSNQNIIESATIADAIPTLPSSKDISQEGRTISDILRSTHDTYPNSIYAQAADEQTNNIVSSIVTADDVAVRAQQAMSSPSKHRNRHNNNNETSSYWWDENWEEESYDDNFIISTIRNSSISLYGGNFGLLSGNIESNYSSLGNTGAGGRLAAPMMGDQQLNIAGFSDESLIHHLPINVGVSVSIPLIKELSLTGGLNYSFLESVSKESRELQNNESRSVQELHYIGISGAINYIPYQTKYWSFYVSGSFALEKAVSARITTTTQYETGTDVEHTNMKVKGVQPSLAAAAGVMLNVTPWMGLYLEPGVAYYINTGQPINYRTENPISFSMQVGLRFRFQ